MNINFFLDKFFVLSLIFIVLSIFYFNKKRNQFSLILLFFGTLFLGLYVSGLDPFINLWDEQFHALVAKNLIKNPFKPILIEKPLFGYVDGYWSYCNIWMHKQPLFLWQMALSLKLFGLSELAIRFPSVLMHSIMIFLIFRIGKIVASDTVGYHAALFFSCSYFPLEYLTGFYATDHNDIAFMFYSFASFWALFEYYSSKRIIFLILIGFLSGGAVLCKWLTGLLVFGIWGLIIIYNSKKNNLRQELLRLFLSFLVCLTIFLPWQIFAYLKYPLEYKAAMDFNARHISEPLEGHGGDFSFYYNALFEQFGSGLIIPPIIIICFLFFIYFMKDKTHKIIIFFTGIITYTFFSFVATKMYGYVLVIFPFFILAISFVFNFYLEKFLHKVFRINLRETLRFIMLMFFLFFLFNPGKFYKHHSNKEYGRLVGRSIDIREKELFLNLKKKFGNEKCIIFNCNTSMGSYILSIFYTDYPSFAFVLNEGQIQEAKKSQYKLIAIDDGKLPDYVIDDKSITRVKF